VRIIIITQCTTLGDLFDKARSMADEGLEIFADIEQAIDLIRDSTGWPRPTRNFHIFLDVQGLRDDKKKRLKRIAKAEEVPAGNIRLDDLFGGAQHHYLRDWLTDLERRRR